MENAKQKAIRLAYGFTTLTITYLLTAFVKFDIYWIKQIANYSDLDRFMMLILLLLTQGLGQVIYNLDNIYKT